MRKLFKPGDKVRLKRGGVVMEVAGYVVRSNFLFPQEVSTEYVECFYFEPVKGKWERARFHQNNLVKVDTTKPVWVENVKNVYAHPPKVLLN